MRHGPLLAARAPLCSRAVRAELGRGEPRISDGRVLLQVAFRVRRRGVVKGWRMLVGGEACGRDFDKAGDGRPVLAGHAGDLEYVA